MGSGRARRGQAPRYADPAVRRLCGLSLVPRDGARVVRRRSDREADESQLHLHQGRPRGTARHRRGVYERDGRDDRSGWLADDMLPHARRPAVLLRYLLSEDAARGHAVVHTGPRCRGPNLDLPPGRGHARGIAGLRPVAQAERHSALRGNDRAGAARRGGQQRAARLRPRQGRVRRCTEIPAIGAARRPDAEL